SKTARKRGKKYDSSLWLALLITGSFLSCIALTIFMQAKKQQVVCANSISCVKDLSGRKEADNTGIFMGHTVTAPDLPDKPPYHPSAIQNVLGASTNDYKHIYIDLTNQKL